MKNVLIYLFVELSAGEKKENKGNSYAVFNVFIYLFVELRAGEANVLLVTAEAE